MGSSMKVGKPRASSANSSAAVSRLMVLLLPESVMHELEEH